MRGKNFFLFFYLPFFGMIALFFVFSFFNRAFIKNKVEALVGRQLYATISLLKADVARFLEEGYSSENIFALYSQEENFYYIALLDGNHDVLSWSSRFEGYLPLSLDRLEEGESWVIDSPRGRIFNLLIPFMTAQEEKYLLYLGYSLTDLETMLAHSRRSFYLMFAAICLIGVMFFVGLFQLQSRYLKKVEEARSHKKEMEHYRDVSAYTSGIAHEIKNPLNSLALLLEMWAPRLPESYRKDIQTGKDEIRKISRIIDQFSAAMKPLKLNRSSFRFIDLIKDAEASVIRDADLPEGSVRVIEGEEVDVYADRDLMTQVIQNLLRNAFEAADTPQVQCSARRSRRGIKVKIRDHGPGIPEELRSRIFNPFFSSKKKGMGIGLYLSKKIIDAHGGKMALAGESSRGAVFEIFIPGK